MKFKYKCSVCGATGWARGWSEPDVNAAGICDDDPMEDACQHIKDGGYYEPVDQEYEDFDYGDPASSEVDREQDSSVSGAGQ